MLSCTGTLNRMNDFFSLFPSSLPSFLPPHLPLLRHLVAPTRVLRDPGLPQDVRVLLPHLLRVLAGERVHLPADPLHGGLGGLGYVGLALGL